MRTFAAAVTLFLLTVNGLGQSYDFLVRDAEKKITVGEYEDALVLYEKAFKSGEYHYNDYYNCACAQSSLGNLDDAFACLEKAVEFGFLDLEQVRIEPCFEKLRKDKRWENIKMSIETTKNTLEALPETHSFIATISLPEPHKTGSISVEEALQNRRSIRNYLDQPMTIEEVSQLLWSAYGITKPFENAPPYLRGGLRTAPSAGARFPLDLYLVVRNVTGLAKGIYFYRSEEHTLGLISKEDRWDALSASAFHQSHFGTATAAIVYSAIFDRNMEKYGQRGRERYVCMDLGHSAENVYLQACALKIGTCGIGAYVDIKLKKLIGMTKHEEPLYIMPLGKVE